MSNNQPTSDKTLNPSPAGKSYNRKAIKKQIGQALANVDGLLAVDGGFFSNLAGKIVNTDKFTSGVKLVLGKEEARVDLNVIAEYQKNVPDLYNEIKRTVTKEVTSLTGHQVVDVNLNVIEIKTQEKQDADSVSLQDHVTHFAEATGEFASDTLGKAKDGIGSGLAAVTEKVGQGVEAAKDAISGGADQAQEVAEEGAQAVEEVADVAKDAVSEVADDAKAVAEEGAQAVQERAEDLAQAGQEAAEEAAHVAEGATEDLAEASQEAVEATAQAGQEATEDVKELAQEAKDAAQEDAQAVKEAVSSSSEQANSK